MIDDCSRGIRDDSIQQTFEKVRLSHGCVVDSSEVKAMVQGRDRRPELGYKLALECRKNIIYPTKNKNSRYNNAELNVDGTLTNINESNHNSAKVRAEYFKIFFYVTRRKCLFHDMNKI